MAANGLEPKETVFASRKLGREDAYVLANKASKLIVAKGKKVTKFATSGTPSEDAIDSMLGPTGNLRAPTLRSGRILIVGFSEEEYRDLLIA